MDGDDLRIKLPASTEAIQNSEDGSPLFGHTVTERTIGSYASLDSGHPFGWGGNKVWHKGAFAPFMNSYKLIVTILGDVLSNLSSQQIFVNSEGLYIIPLATTLSGIALVFVIAACVPLLCPAAAIYGVYHEPVRTLWDWPARLLGVVASLVPALVLVPTWHLRQSEEVKDALDSELLSDVEVLAPILCFFALAAVICVDVFVYNVEQAAAWMVWDEFTDIAESEAVNLGIGERTPYHHRIVQDVVDFLGTLQEKIEVKDTFSDHTYSVQSRFEYRIILALIGKEGAHRTWLKCPPMRSRRCKQSWDHSLGMLLCGTLQALSPTLFRVARGFPGAVICRSHQVMCLRISFMVIAFGATAFAVRPCLDLITRLRSFRTKLLIVIYLMAPLRRRKALGWQYRQIFENIVWLSSEQRPDGTKKIVLATLPQVDKQRGQLDPCEYVLFEQLRSQMRYSVLEHETRIEDPELQALRHHFKKDVSQLGPRRFLMLRTVLRATALVLQVHAERMMIGLVVLMLVFAATDLYMIVVHDSLMVTSVLCLINLLGICVMVVGILNYFVSINRLLLEDSLTVLQAWKQKLDRLRWIGVKDKPICASRAHVESFFQSQLNPLMDIIEYVKTSEIPMTMFGVEITSEMRNKVLLPLCTGLLCAAWSALSHFNWAERLQLVLTQTVRGHFAGEHHNF